MNILTTHRLRFDFAGETFASAGGGNIEYAPDWIVKSDMFAGAKGNGLLTVIDQAPIIAVPAKQEIAPAVDQAPDDKKQGQASK